MSETAMTGEIEARLRAVMPLLLAQDARQTKLHELLETIREQIRLGVAAEHRPDGLFKNIQDAVYAMRGRMPLLNDAAITSPIAEAADALARLTAELARLSDPLAVHINMVRGAIAKPSIENIRHIYPEIAQGEFEARCALRAAEARALTAEAERDQLKIGNRVLDELVTEHCAKRLTAEAALAKAQDGATLAGLLDQADDVWTDYGSGFRIHFSFPPSHQSDVILRINRRRCRARSNGEIP